MDRPQNWCFASSVRLQSRASCVTCSNDTFSILKNRIPMTRGRPPNPGTQEEKAAARRERVRLNVRAYRNRQKSGGLDLPGSTSSRDESRPRASTESPESSKPESQSSRASPSLRSNVLLRRSDSLLEAVDQICRSASPEPGDSLETPSNILRSTAQGTDRQYTTTLLDFFVVQFLPFMGEPLDVSGEGTGLLHAVTPWVKQAREIALNQETGTLMKTMLATSLSLLSRQRSDESLKVGAYKIYQEALQQIQHDLRNFTLGLDGAPSLSLPLYLSCRTAAVFEFLHNGYSSRSTLHHMRGLGMLIEPLAVHFTDDPLTLSSLIEDFRLLEMIFCLKYRTRFNRTEAHERYQFEALDAGTSATGLAAVGLRRPTMLSALLEIIDQLPVIMSRHDSLTASLVDGSTASQLQVLWHKLSEMLAALESWKARLEDGANPKGQAVLAAGDLQTTENRRDALHDGDSTNLLAWTYEAYTLETSIEVLLHLRSVAKSSGPAHSAASTLGSGLRTEIAKLDRLRDSLRVVVGKIAMSLPSFLQPDHGIMTRALALFPLETSIRMLQMEQARLESDGITTQEGLSEHHEEVIHARTALHQLLALLDHCQNMQQKAKALGLPAGMTTETQNELP